MASTAVRGLRAVPVSLHSGADQDSDYHNNKQTPHAMRGAP